MDVTDLEPRVIEENGHGRVPAHATGLQPRHGQLRRFCHVIRRRPGSAGHGHQFASVVLQRMFVKWREARVGR